MTCSLAHSQNPSHCHVTCPFPRACRKAGRHAVKMKIRFFVGLDFRHLLQNWPHPQLVDAMERDVRGNLALVAEPPYPRLLSCRTTNDPSTVPASGVSSCLCPFKDCLVSMMKPSNIDVMASPRLATSSTLPFMDPHNRILIPSRPRVSHHHRRRRRHHHLDP